ncbi:MAG: hypothetical protein QM638_23050 [Nocardioides sp.]|uniref:hypothetical protein n=1 Tax=Nocardioides sp. TaxID=35761 RepID=UPI0039E5EB9F
MSATWFAIQSDRAAVVRSSSSAEAAAAEVDLRPDDREYVDPLPQPATAAPRAMIPVVATN